MNKDLEAQLRNTRIEEAKALYSPTQLRQKLPASDDVGHFVLDSRQTISNILHGRDPRKIIIAGPCSIHNTDAALGYMEKLKTLSDAVKDKIFIVARTYFEKPRSVTGWKGLIRDPFLNGTDDINQGLYKSREFLLQVLGLGLPTTTEVLGDRSVQYFDELLCHGSVGARTAESQPQREVTSGISFPMGLKNGTNGDYKSAVQAVESCAHPHNFAGMNDDALLYQFGSRGHNDLHVILRGGDNGPNYDAKTIAHTIDALKGLNQPNGKPLARALMVDCSHGNSGKDHKKQPDVFNTVLSYMASTSQFVGVMLESYTKAGNQKFVLGETPLEDIAPDISITDKCIDLPTTEELVMKAYRTL